MGCCDAPGLMPVETALDKILSQVTPLEATKTVALTDAMGYVLAQDVHSPINVPLSQTQRWMAMHTVLPILLTPIHSL